MGVAFSQLPNRAVPKLYVAEGSTFAHRRASNTPNQTLLFLRSLCILTNEELPMERESRIATFHPSLLKLLALSAAGVAYACFLNVLPEPASAQNSNTIDHTETGNWARGAIEHARKMLVFEDAGGGSQPAPEVIRKFDVDHDPSGRIATYQPSGVTRTAGNAFFQNIGSNGRTCFTCHQPQN